MALWVVWILPGARVCVCVFKLLKNLHGLAHRLDFKNQRCGWMFNTSAFKQFYFAPCPSLFLPDNSVFSLSFGFSVCWSLSLNGPSSEMEECRALTGYEAPWRGERDRGRRPRQYIYPGESRKTSERFRTQPITSAERHETDRYCSGFKNAQLSVKRMHVKRNHNFV